MDAGLAVVSEGTRWLVPTELKIILVGVWSLTEETGDGMPALVDSVVSVYRVEDPTDF